MSLTLSNILFARTAISGIAVRTPLVRSAHMSRITGSDFLMKLELTQPVGAFKLRGAVNAVSGVAEGAVGVVCCSTGNHGRAVAFAARARGMRAVVCMSSLVPQNKVDGIRALGAQICIFGLSQDEAAAGSRRLAREEGLVEIPPFDDSQVIAGQGTIGLEMLEDRPDLAAILVPLSGGGLAAGVAVAAKAIKPSIKVIGVTMDRGAAMRESLRAGRPVEVDEVASLADSLGGGIGVDNKFTYRICHDLLDDCLLVTEDEIYDAMQTLYFEDRMVAEGASVVGIAAAKSGKLPAIDGPVGTILTGRNVDMNSFTDIISGRAVKLGNFDIKGRAYGA